MEIYKKRHFGTEFTDPDIEAQYDDYAKDKYYREDVPFQVGGFIILCCVLLYYLISGKIFSATLFISGCIPISLALAYAIFGLKFLKSYHSEFLTMLVIPLASLSSAIWIQHERHDFFVAIASAMTFSLIVMIAAIPALLSPFKRLVSNLLCLAIMYISVYIKSEGPYWDKIYMAFFPYSIAATVFVTIAGITRDITNRKLFELNQKVEGILTDVLPKVISDKLIFTEEEVGVTLKSEASVLFADLVGFTKITESTSPKLLGEILNDIFSRFDAITKLSGVEKIKTIGDGYMCAAGVPNGCVNHAERIADAALEMREAIFKYRELTGLNIHVRIGIHTGPVVAGILGKSRYQYDLWGHTVNMASRLESVCPVDCILVGKEMKTVLEHKFEFSQSEIVELKNIGKFETYVLKNPINNFEKEELQQAG